MEYKTSKCNPMKVDYRCSKCRRCRPFIVQSKRPNSVYTDWTWIGYVLENKGGHLLCDNCSYVLSFMDKQEERLRGLKLHKDPSIFQKQPPKFQVGDRVNYCEKTLYYDEYKDWRLLGEVIRVVYLGYSVTEKELLYQYHIKPTPNFQADKKRNKVWRLEDDVRKQTNK